MFYFLFWFLAGNSNNSSRKFQENKSKGVNYFVAGEKFSLEIIFDKLRKKLSTKFNTEDNMEDNTEDMSVFNFIHEHF